MIYNIGDTTSMYKRNSIMYVPVFRKITISCEVFGGFCTNIDIAEFNTTQLIIDKVLNELLKTLEASNMQSLIETLRTLWRQYHIHDYDLGYMLTVDKEYHICNHGCNI